MDLLLKVNWEGVVEAKELYTFEEEAHFGRVTTNKY